MKRNLKILCGILIFILLSFVACNKAPANEKKSEVGKNETEVVQENPKNNSSVNVEENNLKNETKDQAQTSTNQNVKVEEDETDLSSVDMEKEKFINYKDAGFTKEENDSFKESDDGKKLENFKINFRKDDFDFRQIVKDYEYKYKDKTYRGDLTILLTGGGEGDYFATYTGVLEEV